MLLASQSYVISFAIPPWLLKVSCHQYSCHNSTRPKPSYLDLCYVMVITNTQAISGNSFIKNELHFQSRYLNWQWVKCFLLTASLKWRTVGRNAFINDAERMEKCPSFSFPFSPISGCNPVFFVCCSFWRALYWYLPTGFLKFLSLLPNPPDPSKD